MFSLVIVALLGENFGAPANHSRERLDAGADGIRGASQDQLQIRTVRARVTPALLVSDPRLREARRFARGSQASCCLHLVSVVPKSKHKVRRELFSSRRR